MNLQKLIPSLLLALTLAFSSFGFAQDDVEDEVVQPKRPAKKANAAASSDDSIESELEESPAPARAELKKTKEKGLQFLIGAHLSTANKLTSSDAEVNGAKGELEIDTEAAVGLNVELRHARKRKWGFIAGVGHEFAREFKTFKLNYSGNIINGDYAQPAPEASITYIYANALYRWGAFFLPFGLNYSIVDFKSGGNGVSDSEVKGSVGGQVGAGFIINDHLTLDVVLKVLGFTGKESFLGTTIDYGTVILPGLDLGIKYSF